MAGRAPFPDHDAKIGDWIAHDPDTGREHVSAIWRRFVTLWDEAAGDWKVVIKWCHEPCSTGRGSPTDDDYPCNHLLDIFRESELHDHVEEHLLLTDVGLYASQHCQCSSTRGEVALAYTSPRRGDLAPMHPGPEFGGPENRNKPCACGSGRNWKKCEALWLADPASAPWHLVHVGGGAPPLPPRKPTRVPGWVQQFTQRLRDGLDAILDLIESADDARKELRSLQRNKRRGVAVDEARVTQLREILTAERKRQAARRRRAK